MIARRPRAPVFALKGRCRDSAHGAVGEAESDAVHLEQPFVLFQERVLRLGQDLHQGFFLKLMQGCDDWQSADKLGNQTVLNEVLGLNACVQHVAEFHATLAALLCAEA